MKITTAPMTVGTDPSIRRCRHGLAVGFVLNIDRMPMTRSFCDKDECAREARRYGHGCDKAEAVIFGYNAVPAVFA